MCCQLKTWCRLTGERISVFLEFVALVPSLDVLYKGRTIKLINGFKERLSKCDIHENKGGIDAVLIC